MKQKNFLNKIILIFGVFFLFGFQRKIFYPAGIVLEKQHQLIIVAFLMMLIVVIPVIIMTLLFTYLYRASKMNTYNPDWKHSNIIEIIVWIVPIAIICFLGMLTWKTSHQLDPKKTIISMNKPIHVNVVALDWNWLFIYPKEKIATINELILPVNTPVIFNITSNSVMSSFFIPELGSQIYAMPNMISVLNLLAKYPGNYHGFSANYNGLGFSDMKFNTIVLPNQSMFEKWVKKVQNISCQLNTLNQVKLICKPNLLHEIKYFSHIYPNIFKIIVTNSL